MTNTDKRYYATAPLLTDDRRSSVVVRENLITLGRDNSTNCGGFPRCSHAPIELAVGWPQIFQCLAFIGSGCRCTEVQWTLAFIMERSKSMNISLPSFRFQSMLSDSVSSCLTPRASRAIPNCLTFSLSSSRISWIGSQEHANCCVSWIQSGLWADFVNRALLHDTKRAGLGTVWTFLLLLRRGLTGARLLAPLCVNSGG